MTFRDDHEATRVRVAALEQELAAARSELTALRNATTSVRQKKPGSSRGAIALVVLATLLLGAGAYVGLFLGGGTVETVGAVLALAGATLLCFVVFLQLVSSFLFVVPPNQVAILSGKQRRAPDGSMVGFRIVKGGRALQMPIIERLDFMDLTNMAITIEISDCRAKGGTLAIQAFANAKIAGELPALSSAVERFLGQDAAQIARVAEQTIEGTLRGVIAELAVEQVLSERNSAAELVLERAGTELQKLGLVIDTFTLTRVDVA